MVADGVTSRLAGFHKLPLHERVSTIARMHRLTPQETSAMNGEVGLSTAMANQMVENAVGVFDLPLGLGLNMQINGKDYLVPMAVEEPSVIAAVSFAAKIVRESGGFFCDADQPLMIGQVQVARYGDPRLAQQKLVAKKEEILALANSFHPSMVARGGGARDIEVRVLPAPEGEVFDSARGVYGRGEPILVLHLIIDTQEAMGANLINTMCEGVAPMVEQITGGKVYLRILSNLCDRRLARATCRIPVALLADFDMSGEAICDGIVQASRFAMADPYRACTHNKGVMNGVDSFAIATGQDWRAIEAGAHAFAARNGRYMPLSTWTLDDKHLVGRIELPLALGTVGGPIKIHPGVQANLKLTRCTSARELSMVMAAVGLAQNLAAVRALGSVGIQKGHMALHARCVAVTAGARGAWVERIANLLVTAGHVKVEKAKEILASLTPDEFAAATDAG